MVAYINNLGGTKNIVLQAEVMEIKEWAEKILPSVKVIHMKGGLNQKANWLSHCNVNNLEWYLIQEVFHPIVQPFSFPSVDLFANLKK